MVRWSIELSEFGIHYEPRGSIKGQVYVDFIVELMFGVLTQIPGISSGFCQWMVLPINRATETGLS